VLGEEGRKVKPNFVLGIDPGLSGALCLLRISDRQISLFDMPVTDGRVDPAKLAGIIEMCKMQGSIVAAVENVSSMPRQAGAFNFGRSAGVVHGVLGAMGVSMELVSPNVWKKVYGLYKLPNENQADTKNRARVIASKLWPECAANFKRVKDADRSESCLIARFWASKNGWL
jgi:hypothetical protein